MWLDSCGQAVDNLRGWKLYPEESLAQAKGKCDSLVLNVMKMPWCFACLLFWFLLFRTNGRRGHLDENGFCRFYGNFFRKWHSESYLIIAMFKVPFQQLRRTTENSILKNTLQLNILRTWINIRAKSFIKILVNIIKRKSMNMPGKILVAQNSELALWRTLHQNRPLLTYFIRFFFSQI